MRQAKRTYLPHSQLYIDYLKPLWHRLAAAPIPPLVQQPSNLEKRNRNE